MRPAVYSRWKLKDLQLIVKAQSPPVSITTTTKSKIAIKGWIDKTKGLRQVLWERGWIEKNKLRMYQKLAVDDEGEEIIKYSLLRLTEQCLGFVNEVTEMEIMAERIGVLVICTTKYHAKLAGKGVEYSWGIAKCKLRNLNICEDEMWQRGVLS